MLFQPALEPPKKGNSSPWRPGPAPWSGSADLQGGYLFLESTDLLAQGFVFERQTACGDRQVGVVAPPVEADLLGLVDGADEEADADGEQLDLRERDPDVARDHQPLVQDPVEHVDQAGRPAVSRLDRPVHASPSMASQPAPASPHLSAAPWRPLYQTLPVPAMRIVGLVCSRSSLALNGGYCTPDGGWRGDSWLAGSPECPSSSVCYTPPAMSEPVYTPKPGRPRVGMISLGCPKNRVSSEVMLGELARRGYEVVSDLDAADTVVVNTCAFIEEAQQESIDTILEVVGRKGQGVERVLVAGCMVNRFGQELAREIPEIDGFVGLDQLRQVPDLVQLGGGPPLPAPSHLVFDHTAPRLLTTRGHAYLKVAEGCNNPCTFCAIPSWRGRFRSRTVESLVAEARALEEQGIRELNLIAQDTTRYGEDLGLGRHGLVRLVEALLAATDIPWIRFLYAYPTTLDEDLLRLMESEPRFCSYVDMPLQHSHGQVLAAMRRGGDARRYLRLLEPPRERAPDVFRPSSFIVGFPGESEDHFQDLLPFVDRARLDHLGAFA